MVPIKTNREQNNTRTVAMLHLERDLNVKKTDLFHIVVHRQELIKNRVENVILIDKLQQEIIDFETYVEKEQLEFDNKVLAERKQLKNDKEEKEKLLQSISQTKVMKEEKISKYKRQMEKISGKIAKLKQQMETVKNANSVKKEEVETKTRLCSKLEGERAKLSEEYNTFQRPVLKPNYHNNSMSQPTGILKKPDSLIPPMPIKKVTFPDLSSETSSEVVTSVSQTQVCKLN